MKFKEGWCLLYTKCRHERKIAENLDERKIAQFLPTMRVTEKRQNRNRIAEVPLFPSYVFVYLQKREQYFECLENESVIGFVKTGKEISYVKPEIVDNLKILVNNEGGLEVTGDRFVEGEKILIRKGALAGLFCEVVQYRNERKILVRVEILNRSVLTGIPVSFLVD